MFQVYFVEGTMDKAILLAIQRGTWNMCALLPQIPQLTAVSLDAILKNMIPLILMHLQYYILKKHGDKSDSEGILHSTFVRQLASCKNQEDFKELADKTKDIFQLPTTLQPMVNMMKFKMLANDLSDQYNIIHNSQLIAKRIYQCTEFAINISRSGRFRHQLYEHMASILALLDQDSPNILTHFNSLLTLGSVTFRLARLYKWDLEYIGRVRSLYGLENHDETTWFSQFNTYLERRGTYRGSADYFTIVLNKAIIPDQNYNLRQNHIPDFREDLEIYAEDIKMMSLATDILNVSGTIDQLERVFSTSTQIVDGEAMSTVEEILSQTTSDTTNMSRATSIINDETQRNWNASTTDNETSDISDDESYILHVCQHYDGEESRSCGTIIAPGETRCDIHKIPDYNQPMEMIKNMKDIEPGRAYSIMKDVVMEVPRPKKDIHATYANNYNGDTKSFMNSFTKFRKLMHIAYDAFPGLGQSDTFRNFDAQPFIQEFEEVDFSEARWYAIYQSIKDTIKSKQLPLNMPWINHAYKLADKQGRIQGFISIDRTQDRLMAREDRVIRWEKPYSKTTLDPAIFRPEVREQIPALYITENHHRIPSYLNHQTDGYYSQTGKYEKGIYQSEYSQPIFGIFHDQRPLMYENPNPNTKLEKKALVMIQVEMETTPIMNREVGRFHDRLNMTASDKVERIKVQLKSIEAHIGIEIQSFEDLDTLAREIDEPTLKQEDLDKMLRHVFKIQKVLKRI